MTIQATDLKPTVSSAPLSGFWGTFSKNRMGLIGLLMLVVILIVAIFAPILAPYDPESTAGLTSDDIYNAPGVEHWLGTDDAGKDVLSSFIYGTRVSLIVGFFAAFISIVLGGVIG